MVGVVTATARHYAGELDGSRKRRRTSTPAGSDDEEQEDAEAIDFEVSFNISGILLVSQLCELFTGTGISTTLFSPP